MNIQTKLKGVGATLTCALALVWAGPAAAQFGPAITPKIAEEMAAKNFTPPRIPFEQLENMAKQPNFQGEWIATGPGGGGALTVVFDPFNVWTPYEVTAGLFGPTPGTYMTKIPYNAEYAKKYKKIIADQVAGKSRDTYALCLPYGMPRFMGGAAVGFDLIQNSEVISMQNWYDNEQRRIFLDGRPHPMMDPMGGENPRTYTGHSVGHWEGDVLVVDTANMVAGVYDDTEAPYSDQIHLTERIRLIAPTVLEDQMTIDDSGAFTAPWTVTRYFARAPQFGPPPPPPAPPGEAGAAAPAPPPAAAPAPRPAPQMVHNLADRVCHETIDMSKGFQSVILPQEIDAREKKKKKSAPVSTAK